MGGGFGLGGGKRADTGLFYHTHHGCMGRRGGHGGGEFGGGVGVFMAKGQKVLLIDRAFRCICPM